MNTDPSMVLAAHVRSERLRLGWTQADTASRAEVSLRTYRRFESLGRTTIDQFVKIAAGLGLNVELTGQPDAAIAADPRATKPRQRGVRRARVRADAGKQKPSVADQKPTVTIRSPTKYRAPQFEDQQPAASAAEIAAITKKYRDSIDRLAAMIVANRLTNSTSTQLARNFMSSDSVPKADQPAYLAAVLSVLSQLTSDNAAAHGCRPEQLEGWKSGWHFDQSIPGAID